MRLLFFFLLLFFSFASASAQDTCACSEIRNKSGNNSLWELSSRGYGGKPFTGICFDGERSMNASWKKYKDGYLYEYRMYVYDSIAHYTYKEYYTDTLISIAEEYSQYSKKIGNKTVVFEKNGQRYRRYYVYAMDGKLMEVTQDRYLRKGEEDWLSYKTERVNKDGFYISPIQDGPYLFYGGRWGIKRCDFPLVSGQYSMGKKTGHWFENHENGKLKSSGWYKDDHKDSLWTTYFNNGKIESQGYYRLNAKDGEWKYWDYNGQLVSDELYKDFVKTGKCTEYHPNGKLKSETVFVNGKPDGKAQTWYENGQLSSVFNYQNGLKNGEGKTWFANGQLKSSAIYQDNLVKGVYREWYADGQTALYQKHIGAGPMDTAISWYPNGTKKSLETFRADGTRQSTFTWYDNGAKQTEEHYGPKNTPAGTFSWWNEKGILVKQVDYRNGVIDGNFRTWNDEGKPVVFYHYSNYVRDGQCLRWDKTGRLEFDQVYRNGRPHNSVKTTSAQKAQPGATAASPVTAGSSETPSALVLYLALSQMRDSASPYFDSVIIPKKLISQVERTLNILQQNNAVMAGEYNAGAPDNYYSFQMVVSNYSGKVPEWVENWKKGIDTTGVSAIDKIIRQYVLKPKTNGFSQYGSQGFFYFESVYPLNTDALDRALKKADAHLHCEFLFSGIGDGNHTRITRKDGYSDVQMIFGYGDCPAGCIGHDLYLYRVYDDGEMDLISAPQNRNGQPIVPGIPGD